MSGERGLNAKRRLFVEIYLADPKKDKIAAYMGAYPGCKEVGQARIRAVDLLKNADVRRYIASKNGDRANPYNISVESVMEEISSVAFTSITDFFIWGDEGLTLRPKNEIDSRALRAIREIRISRTRIEPEDGPPIVREQILLQLHDKMRACEMLGKHTGAWAPEADNHNTFNFYIDIPPRVGPDGKLLNPSKPSGPRAIEGELVK